MLFIKLSLKKRQKKKSQAASDQKARPDVLFALSFAIVPKVTYSFALPASVSCLLPVQWCRLCLVRCCAASRAGASGDL